MFCIFSHCSFFQLIVTPSSRNPDNVSILSLHFFSCCVDLDPLQPGPSSGLPNSVDALARTLMSKSTCTVIMSTALSPHSPALSKGPSNLVLSPLFQILLSRSLNHSDFFAFVFVFWLGEWELGTIGQLSILSTMLVLCNINPVNFYTCPGHWVITDLHMRKLKWIQVK